MGFEIDSKIALQKTILNTFFVFCCELNQIFHFFLQEKPEGVLELKVGSAKRPTNDLVFMPTMEAMEKITLKHPFASPKGNAEAHASTMSSDTSMGNSVTMMCPILASNHCPLIFFLKILPRVFSNSGCRLFDNTSIVSFA